MNLIELHQVSKAFGRRPAIELLDLAVPRGSIFGLLGHNGAGKSTALGVVLGQVFPDAGRVTIHGHDVFRRRGAALARVGAIFEAPAFYDYLTGRRNLIILCEYSARARQRRIDEVVAFVGLSGRIDDRVGTYSHGMRQRLALAQALLPGPEVLILDEPNEGLDPEGIRDMRDLVLRLNRTFGLTILFSSHQLHEVEQLCTHVAVLHRGRRVYAGPWQDIGAERRLVRLDVDRGPAARAALAGAGLIAGTAGPDRVCLAPGAEVPDLVRLLVEHGHQVRAIAPVRPSLEDFYLATVEGATGDRGAAAEAG